MPEPKFMPCMQDRPMLLPPDIGDLVPEGSMARVVDMTARSIDGSTLISPYPGGGAPAHDPQMMPKAIPLAYASGVYSSRAIARATRESVGFLWACGMGPPGRMTTNRLRAERVRHVFEGVFSEAIQPLADMGLVTLGTCFPDGTKVGASANRLTFAWAKPAKRHKERLGARAHAHLAAIDEMDEEEALAPEGPAEVGSGAIAEAARRISEGIGRKRVGKRPGDDEGRAPRKAKRMPEGEWRERMERHEGQEGAPAGRGSHSKTDRDATFTRMKEGSPTNQTKPGHDARAGTEGQLMPGVTCHQRPSDAARTIERLEHARETIGHPPSETVADAGHGSERSCAWLEGRGRDACARRSESFRGRGSRKWREDPMGPANRGHDEGSDTHACPGGRTPSFSREGAVASDLGHESATGICVREGCPECPLGKGCSRSKDPDAVRVLRVSPVLDALRARAPEMPRAERGSTLGKQGSVDVEDHLRRHQARLGVQAVPPAGPGEGGPRGADGRDGTQHREDGLRPGSAEEQLPRSLETTERGRSRRPSQPPRPANQTEGFCYSPRLTFL